MTSELDTLIGRLVDEAMVKHLGRINAAVSEAAADRLNALEREHQTRLATLESVVIQLTQSNHRPERPPVRRSAANRYWRRT